LTYVEATPCIEETYNTSIQGLFEGEENKWSAKIRVENQYMVEWLGDHSPPSHKSSDLRFDIMVSHKCEIFFQ
jgi:hypothetical protein